MRLFAFPLLAALMLGLAPAARADSVQGSYVEVRSAPPASPTDSAPPPAHALLAWQVRIGSFDGEKLDGLTIVAAVTAEPSAGDSFARTTTVFIVDSRLSVPAEQALVHLAKALAPAIIHDPGTVVRARLDVRIAEGCGCGVAVVNSPLATVRTRPLSDTDTPAAGENDKPLAEVFSSRQVFAEQYLRAGEPPSPGHSVTAFTGSFSK